MVNLSIDQLFLELPSAHGLSHAAGQRLVHEALSLLAERLAQTPSVHGSMECQMDKLNLEGLTLESLQGPQGPATLCDALYARLMEALQ